MNRGAHHEHKGQEPSTPAAHIEAGLLSAEQQTKQAETLVTDLTAPLAPRQDQADLEALLVKWVRTPDWPSSMEYLQAHPELLTETAEQVLTALIQLQTDGRNQALLTLHHQLLCAARQQGVEVAYAPLQESSSQASSPTNELNEVVTDLGTWLDAPDLATSKSFLQTHSYLLSEKTERFLEQFMHFQPEEDVREILRTRLALLHKARVWGILGTYTYYHLAEQVKFLQVHERDTLIQQLHEWLSSPTEEQSKDYLETHPHLLTAAGEALLARLWQGQQTDEEHVLVAQHLQLLQQARREGIVAAYREYDPVNLINVGVEALRLYQMHGNAADLDQALGCWQQALMVILSDSPNRLILLTNLGLGLRIRYERMGALADLDQAFTAFQHALNETSADSPDYPIRLSNLGICLKARYERMGALADLDKAIAACQQAVDAIPAGSPDHPFLMSNLGICLNSRYRRAGALADLDKAIAACQHALDRMPPDSLDLPMLQGNLGTVLHTRYERTGALADLDQAIAACQQAVNAMPAGSSIRFSYLSMLGRMLRTRYQRTGALVDLDQAIAACQQAVDAISVGSPDYPLLLNNLGLGLFARYERTSALSDLEQALVAHQQAVDAMSPDYPDRAALLNNLGNGWSARYNHTRALADLDKALAIYQHALDGTPADSPDLADCLNGLGRGLRARYERTGALTDLEQAIAVYRQTIGSTPSDSPLRPLYLNNLGNALRARYERTRVLADLEQALMAHQQAVDAISPDSSARPTLLNNLGNALRTRYERTRVLADLDKALAVWEASWASRYIRFVFIPVPYQIGQQRQEGGLAAALVAAYLERAACSHSSRQVACRRAFEVAEASKSRLLTQIVGRGPLPLPPGLSPQDAAREQQLLSDLTALDTQDLVSHDRSPMILNPLLGPTRLKQRQLLAQELEELWASIARLGAEGTDYVALRRGDSPAWESLARLARELDPTTALLSLFTTPDRVLLFLLRATWRLPRVVAAPLDQIGWDNLLDRFFREVQLFAPGLRRSETWDQPLHPLLFHAQRHLIGAERLILALAGNGHLLPWGVLAERSGWRTPMGESLPVVTLPALGVLPRLRQRPHVPNGQTLVVGNPLGDLPHAEVEAKVVAERFGTSPLVRGAATKKTVLTSLEGASLIHLATHAFFDPKDPLDSGIVLTDGIITAREVLQHHLQADLLVLSACESGRVGSLGGEELAGVSQAFLQAGVRSLLVSLWKVNDPATAALMEAFYAARQAGADKALALRQAMTQIQQDHRWSHPYYWGAFVLVGDWE